MRRSAGMAGVVFGAVLVMASSASVVQAAGKTAGGNKLTMSGCGLGYMLFGKDYPSNRGLQILAVTTNGTAANGLFGITSGTSGCTEDGTIASNQALGVYAEVNFTNLAQEMAQGDGEYVGAFASLLGATETSRPALLQFFREKYEVLFPSADTTSAQMLEHLMSELATRPDLLG
ncbi:MAG: DUF3015 family protein [Nitrospirae bacterium]|nr:DUF3015 family protein [Nitrospirota bacterium]